MTMPALAPLDLRSGAILGDQVYEAIGAAILDGRFGPGERLRDLELAAQLGVSRTPVREALQRLERFGLVEIAVGRYTRVSVPDDSLRTDTGVFTTYFLGNAVRVAVAVCSDDELDHLVGAADALAAAAASADHLRLFDASAVFFEAATRSTGNAVFLGFIREASLALQRNLRGWRPFLEHPLARADGYLRLRDRIAERDGDGAERELRWIHGIA